MDEFSANTGICLWCEQPAEGSHHGCYHHDPDFAELRRERASRAAKSKGNAELRKLKAEVKGVIAELRAGEMDRNVGTAVLQGYRVMRDLIELERRIKETDELARDIAAIKEQVEHEY
jgi:hypothetical protein